MTHFLHVSVHLLHYLYDCTDLFIHFLNGLGIWIRNDSQCSCFNSHAERLNGPVLRMRQQKLRPRSQVVGYNNNPAVPKGHEQNVNYRPILYSP